MKANALNLRNAHLNAKGLANENSIPYYVIQENNGSLTLTSEKPLDSQEYKTIDPDTL